jgi:hypothetical protein
MVIEFGSYVSMLAPVTHFLPLTLIRRERLLPQPGKVLVRSGQKVAATDAIAEATLFPDFLLLDVARSLQLSTSKTEQHLQCHVGDQLAQGDVIAGPVGLANRIVRAPRDGKVVLVGEGQVLLETTGKLFQLKAGIPGNVVELIGDRGAVIETTGALIQGVWGNGRVDAGVMSVLAKKPEMLLTIADLDVSLRGSIILAGYCNDPDVLYMADELPLRGLVFGSLAASLLPVAAKLTCPVLIIEGFGDHPLNPMVFKLLSTSERREVALNAEAWDRNTGARPELVIPLPAPGSTTVPQDTIIFEVEKQVRVLRGPHACELGMIISLKGNVVFPGGLHARAAEVRFENGKTQFLPLANLEIVS